MIYNHITQNHISSIDQYGFTKGRSCTTQLLVTLNEWLTDLDNDFPVEAIYLDLRKVFDTVPHKRLLTKLEGYGVRGNLLNWIKDFLSDRTQYVSVNGNSGVLTVFAHHRFANQSNGERIIPSSLFARLANQYFGINEQSVTNKSFRNTRLFCWYITL